MAKLISFCLIIAYLRVTAKEKMKRMLSETLTGKKPDYEVVFIPKKLHKKIAEHAEQKGIKVDQEVAELLELAIKVLEVHMAAKDATKGADQEL
jgi:LDH2 family malate/lactate/ureidoglycolate dehydrogenase